MGMFDDGSEHRAKNNKIIKKIPSLSIATNTPCHHLEMHKPSDTLRPRQPCSITSQCNTRSLRALRRGAVLAPGGAVRLPRPVLTAGSPARLGSSAL